MRRIPRSYLNQWKRTAFNKRWEESWSAKVPKVFTVWKIESRALTYFSGFFSYFLTIRAIRHLLSSSHRAPNQRRAIANSPLLDADWIWPMTMNSCWQLTADSAVMANDGDDWRILCRRACLWRYTQPKCDVTKLAGASAADCLCWRYRNFTLLVKFSQTKPNLSMRGADMGCKVWKIFFQTVKSY